MVCFLACFGTPKLRKPRKLANVTPSGGEVSLLPSLIFPSSFAFFFFYLNGSDILFALTSL